MFRRKRLPPELERSFAAFVLVVRRVEAAKAALTEAVPSTRSAGRPLAEALFVFEEELRSASQRMSDWRCEQVEGAWISAEAGIEQAMALAQRVRLEADGPQGFEGLIGLLADLLAPLESFEGAGEAFEGLRN